MDFHCPRAVRILDFPHAAERVSQIGEVLWGEGQASTKSWLEQRLHQLKHEGPAALLAELRDLHDQQPGQTVLAENLAYLEKRAGHMQYPQYQAQGWPIGSGVVESANKVVVEARSKGRGSTGPRLTSTRCSPCATWSATTAGMKVGCRLPLSCGDRRPNAGWPPNRNVDWQPPLRPVSSLNKRLAPVHLWPRPCSQTSLRRHLLTR